MYKVIIDPVKGQRVSATYRHAIDAIEFAHNAIKEPEFQSVRVFDPTGHIIAQAYKEEGGQLR